MANLPYNVATPLVLHLLEREPLISRMLVMVQSEVGERLAAHAGDEAYGAASLRVQYFADARVVGKVRPDGLPAPSPTSTRPWCRSCDAPQVRVDPALVSEEALFEVDSHRVRRSGERCCAGRSPRWASEGVFERAGVAETRRPEELTIEEFARLAAAR